MEELSSCTKLRRFSLRTFAFVLAVTLGPCNCRADSNQTFLGIPELFGPSEAVVGDIVLFTCRVPNHPKNESVLLQLYKKGNKIKQLGESTSLSGEAGNFSLVIKLAHEGSLECIARGQNNSDIRPTVSRTHSLRVVEEVKGAQLVISPDSNSLYMGYSVHMRCDITAGNYVSYEWQLDGRPISPSPGRRLMDNHLHISSATTGDRGSYVCVAINYCDKRTFVSASRAVEIEIKDVVSDPDISFTVLKETSHNYLAVVRCESAVGTPPVTFLLYNGTKLVGKRTSGIRSAMFMLPLVLDQYLGELQCKADNGVQIGYSQWMPLEVVSVGGPVTIHFDSDIGEDLAVVGLRMYCRAAKGSHPRYQWFLNQTLLQDRGSFYAVADQPPEQSVLLLSVGRMSAGTYRCQVSDSFDNTTAISSKRLHLNKRVLNRLPVLAVAVVFGCFTLLILLVSFCCVMGAVYRRKVFEDKSLFDLEMERNVTVNENEPDLRDYSEDVGVVGAARGEFDQISEASEDEWPQIAEQKKTLEDEAFEEP